jgi:hypothetical protein
MSWPDPLTETALDSPHVYIQRKRERLVQLLLGLAELICAAMNAQYQALQKPFQRSVEFIQTHADVSAAGDSFKEAFLPNEELDELVQNLGQLQVGEGLCQRRWMTITECKKTMRREPWSRPTYI